ncbi:hypothetical protein F443_01249, partial [Phytophthora nicotianae P1569]
MPFITEARMSALESLQTAQLLNRCNSVGPSVSQGRNSKGKSPVEPSPPVPQEELE